MPVLNARECPVYRANMNAYGKLFLKAKLSPDEVTEYERLGTWLVNYTRVKRVFVQQYDVTFGIDTRTRT